MHGMAWLVALDDVGEALADGQPLAVRAGRHVAVSEGVVEVAGRRGELAGQVGGQAMFGGRRRTGSASPSEAASAPYCGRTAQGIDALLS